METGNEADRTMLQYGLKHLHPPTFQLQQNTWLSFFAQTATTSHSGSQEDPVLEWSIRHVVQHPLRFNFSSSLARVSTTQIARTLTESRSPSGRETAPPASVTTSSVAESPTQSVSFPKKALCIPSHRHRTFPSNNRGIYTLLWIGWCLTQRCTTFDTRIVTTSGTTGHDITEMIGTTTTAAGTAVMMSGLVDADLTDLYPHQAATMNTGSHLDDATLNNSTLEDLLRYLLRTAGIGRSKRQSKIAGTDVSKSDTATGPSRDGLSRGLMMIAGFHATTESDTLVGLLRGP